MTACRWHESPWLRSLLDWCAVLLSLLLCRRCRRHEAAGAALPLVPAARARQHGQGGQQGHRNDYFAFTGCCTSSKL